MNANLEIGRNLPPLSAALGIDEKRVPRSSAVAVGFWTVTGIFCLQIGFTAYAQLGIPQVAAAFAHLGFPDYFRVALAWVKLLGIVALLAPVSARLKEWAYAGFAFTLGAALLAHLAVGDGPEAWGFAAGTGVLWAVSYLLWRLRVTHLADSR
jgi:hypothetical protein